MANELDEAAFREAVDALVRSDAALAEVVTRHGAPPFWHRPPGFSTLILLILEQQVSLASARAAFDRLELRLGEVSPAAVASLDESGFREVGFSRQKTRYAMGLAGALLDGRLDLAALARLPDVDARQALLAIRGVGPWTADVYLLSALRRPDIWPVGDRALQVAAGEVLGLGEVPPPEGLAELGDRWRPHRSSAARLLWHAYLSKRGR